MAKRDLLKLPTVRAAGYCAVGYLFWASGWWAAERDLGTLQLIAAVLLLVTWVAFARYLWRHYRSYWGL